MPGDETYADYDIYDIYPADIYNETPNDIDFSISGDCMAAKWITGNINYPFIL